MIIDYFCDATGEATVLGKLWRWEFHHYLGPTFVKANGEPIKNQLPPKRVWDAFYDWHEAKIGPLPWRQEQRDMQKAFAEGAIVIRMGEK